MFKGKEFYNGTVEKLTALLGLMFSNVKYATYDNQGNMSFKPVKLLYAENFKERKDIYDYLANKPQVARQLPIISYHLAQMRYNSSLNRSGHLSVFTEGTEIPAPVPYIFSFQFDIIAKSNTAGYSIMEQILPYFTPGITIKQRELKNLNIEYDVNINMTSPQKNASQEIEQSKLFEFNAGFMLDVSANLYKFVNTDIGEQINTIFVNNRNMTTLQIIESITITEDDL